jgi:hypothetical protein
LIRCHFVIKFLKLNNTFDAPAGLPFNSRLISNVLLTGWDVVFLVLSKRGTIVSPHGGNHFGLKNEWRETGNCYRI